MRLDCSLWFQNSNDKIISRKAQGIVSLGRKENSRKHRNGEISYFLVVSTRQNNHPTKLELNKMRTIWRKMAKQGKATIEFEDPKLTLFITEAKPEQLLTFLVHLENIKNGKTPTNVQPVGKTPQLTASAIANRQIKMSINSSKNYPESHKDAFPSCLKELSLNQISLRLIDTRWFNLHALTHLSLENNKLGKQWTQNSWNRFCAISRLKNLARLNLNGNPFIDIPDEFLDSLPKIAALQLANCKLRRLSNQISCLQSLRFLDISANPMEELPEDLCFLPHLRHISLSKMRNLRFLPATLFHNSSNFNRFSQLDVSNNENSPFTKSPEDIKNNAENAENVAEIPSLGVIAAAAVLNNPQYLRPDGSHIISPSVRDCLPRLVHQEMRNCLLRCAECFRLYPQSQSSNVEYFYRIRLLSFTHSLLGPSPALIRLQICNKCPK